MDVQAGIEAAWSDWREYAAAGGQLVHEQGWLQGPGAALRLACGPWRLQAQLSQRGGTRHYDGQTGTGASLQTASTLTHTQGHVQLLWDVHPAWGLGLRAGAQAITRGIASTGVVSGYPESYAWSLASLGAQWRHSLGDTAALSVDAWWGRALDSRMWVRLPGRDPATLGLGDITQAELAVRMHWAASAAKGWSGELAWVWTRLEMEQGPSGAITTNGVLTGSARQPRSVWVESPVSLSVRYRF
ncbi:MAG: hypothetical protein ACT4NV_11575 [Rhodoferax sp.]